MKQAVQVTILGQQYTVRSDIPPEEVLRVADFVNCWITETAVGGKSVDSLNTVVLALLNLGGAYLRLQEKGAEKADNEMADRLRRLLDKLEKAVPQAEPVGERKPECGQ